MTFPFKHFLFQNRTSESEIKKCFKRWLERNNRVSVFQEPFALNEFEISNKMNSGSIDPMRLWIWTFQSRYNSIDFGIKRIKCRKFRFRTKLRQEYFSKVGSESRYPADFYDITVKYDEPIAEKCSLHDYENIYLLTGFLLILSDGSFHVNSDVFPTHWKMHLNSPCKDLIIVYIYMWKT